RFRTRHVLCGRIVSRRLFCPASFPTCCRPRSPRGRSTIPSPKAYAYPRGNKLRRRYDLLEIVPQQGIHLLGFCTCLLLCRRYLLAWVSRLSHKRVDLILGIAEARDGFTTQSNNDRGR